MNSEEAEFKKKSKEERLILITQSSIKALYRANDDKDYPLLSYYYFLVEISQLYAYKAFYLDNDIEKAKWNFYCGASFFLESCRRMEKPMLNGRAFNGLPLVMLSDNKDLIESYARLPLEGKESYERLQVLLPVMLVQGILIDDESLIQEGLPVRPNKLKQWGFTLDFEFLLAVKDRDLARAQAAINAMLTPGEWRRRCKFGVIYREFFLPLVLAYAKIAWYKGLPILVNHPRFPQALMPLNPLTTYPPPETLFPGLKFKD